MGPEEWSDKEEAKAFHKRWCDMPPQRAAAFVQSIEYAILGEGSTFAANHMNNIRELLKTIDHLKKGNSVQKGTKDETCPDNPGTSRDWQDHYPVKDS